VARGPLPALVVCHGGSIRRALASRRPEALAEFATATMPNATLVQVMDGAGQH
jgi:broad specificity phosphatase PhoE